MDTSIALPEEIVTKRDSMEFAAEALKVDSPETSERARVFTKDLATLKKKVTALCDEFVNPIKTAFDAVKKAKKSHLEPIENASRMLRTKLGEYATKIAKEEAEARARIAEAAEVDVSEVAVPSQVQKGFRDVTDYNVVDEEALPKSMMSPDMKKIKAFFASNPGGTIPGVEVSVRKTPVVR